jgi:hypothetical protein
MAATRLAVIQSSYIPWKGYFDLIRAADQFVLLDDVQFTKRDWRSRNRIKTKDGSAWLSIPVHTSGRYSQRIEDTTISDPDWAKRHWDTIRHSYVRAPFFETLAPLVEPLYMNPVSDRLSLVNHAFLVTICGLLGITTPISWSAAYRTRDDRNERLIDICHACDATEYLTGPSAVAYLDDAAFRAAGITIRVADYGGYPEYAQPHPPFDHFVSALDLLFCTGPRAIDYMKDVCPPLSTAS